jgi:hypothetical protein
MRPARAVAVIAWLMLVWPAGAEAHSTGESFLALRPTDAGGEIAARWDLAVRDLDDALVPPIDGDGDGHVTAGELRGRQADIEAYAFGRLTAATPTAACSVRAHGFDIAHRSSGAYVTLDLRFSCGDSQARAPARLTIDDRAFFDRDGLHRAFVTLEDGTHSETTLLRAGQTGASFALGPRPAKSDAGTTASFVREGVLHIWQGLDHVLFLIVLLLPAVLRRRDDAGDGGATWTPVESLRPALTDVLRVITAFTVAHSITLGLAAVGALHAAGRIIEPAIAASVVLAAANNLYPLFGRDRWVVAFALGLLHGFGFSAVLAEVGLPQGHLLAALFGFNLGVELGQLALVALVVPLAYLARKTVLYRRLGLAVGSALAGGVAVVWMIERILNVSLL